MSFLSVLTLVFVVLKLMSVIDWSWWFVLAPTILHIFLFISLLVYVTGFHRAIFHSRKK